MTREELMAAVEAAKAETREALQLVYDSLNQGQQKKLLKQDGVKALFDRYKVEYKQ
jgi:hypothetical protein